jgi:hypothetical protein
VDDLSRALVRVSRFLSLRNRFFVNVHGIAPRKERPSSTVLCAGYETRLISIPIVLRNAMSACCDELPSIVIKSHREEFGGRFVWYLVQPIARRLCEIEHAALVRSTVNHAFDRPALKGVSGERRGGRFRPRDMRGRNHPWTQDWNTKLRSRLKAPICSGNAYWPSIADFVGFWQ